MARKIAILGGGMSALTTAYHLTSLPDWRERYDLTVYQMGWRLGGKCAAGRNQGKGDRIEEHGLHVLFGWYENVFRVARGCYAALNRSPEFEKAFVACGSLVAPEIVDGNVLPWEVLCPSNGDQPGVGPDVSASPAQYVKNLFAWVARQLTGWAQSSPRGVSTVEELRDEADTLTAAPRGTETPDALVQIAQVADALAESTPNLNEDRERLEELSRRFCELSRVDDLWYALSPPDGAAPRGLIGDLRTALRRLRIFADFAFTAAKGLLVDLAGRSNWFDLDDRDLRDWLRHHGAAETTVRSVIVDAIYSAVFSPAQPVGAGTMMQCALRAAFFFKGAAVLRPNGSVADVLFAPLYRTLAARGVRFEFFHRVEQLELSEDRQRVQRIRFDIQARPKGAYDPLIAVRGADAWPNQPRYELLQDGEALRAHDSESWWDRYSVGQTTLEQGVDFDEVVLGISVAAIPDIFRDAMFDSKNDKFQWMVRALGTTQTQAMQLWFESPENNGWPGPLPANSQIAIPYQMPFDTVAEMRDALSQEAWNKPISRLYYLCAALDDDEPPAPRSDSEYPARQTARVKKNGAAWLSDWGGKLWAGKKFTDSAWFDEQYFNAPVNPSDRYVLVLPGSHRYRLRADESGYENLYLTGDWTKNSVSAGCLESAAAGGVQTARAIDPRVPKAAGDWLDEPKRVRAVPDLRAEKDLRVEPGTPVSPAPPSQLIFRDGELLAQPPIFVPRMELYTFILGADLRQLQRLCDAQLNLGPSLRYRPLGPFVTFYCASMTNQVDPYGQADELDFGFWVPLVAPDGDAQRIATYSPYVWVDNSWALVAGRSLFGFPKQLGDLTFAPGDGKFELSTLVLPQRGQNAEKRPLVSVRRFDAAPTRGNRFDSWAGFTLASAKVAGRLFDQNPAAMLQALGQLAQEPGMPMVFLKQIPGAGVQRSACYQAVVEAPIDIVPGSFSAAPLDGTWEIALYDYESHHIADTLGLDRGPLRSGAALLRPLTQAQARFSAWVQPGKEVWLGSR